MSKHQTDLELCGKLSGKNIGLVCDRCDGRCILCDSYVALSKPARICDDCAHVCLSSSNANSSEITSANRSRCVVCAANLIATGNVHQALFCRSCVMMEKDRDGCPRVLNLGSARMDSLLMSSSRK